MERSSKQSPSSAPAAPADEVRTLIDLANRAPSPSAVPLWRLALELIDPHDQLHAVIEANLARSLMASGATREAAALAERLAVQAHDPAVAIRSDVTRAFAAMAAEGADDILEPLDAEVIDALRSATDGADRRAGVSGDPAEAVGDHALALLLGGRALAAEREATLALTLGATGQAAMAARMGLAAVALYDGRTREAVDHADELMRIVRGGDEEFLLAGYGPWLVDGIVRIGSGDPQAAIASIEEGNRIAALVSMPMLQAHFAPIEMLALLGLGRWDEAHQRLTAALDVAESTGYHMFSAWLWALRSLLGSWRGDVAEAASSLERAGDYRTAQHSGLQHRLWAESTAARFAGDGNGALEPLRRLHDDLEHGGIGSGWWPITIAQIRAEVGEGGNPRRAVALLDRLPVGDATTPILGAVAAAGRAITQSDVVTLAESAEILVPSFALEAAELRFDAARFLLRRGDVAAAGRVAQLAQKGFGMLGANAPQAELTRWLTTTGLTLPTTHRPRSGVTVSLTKAEQRVARLVCEGLTNADIAARLGISSRTVETHLHRVFAKVGVRSRTRLMAVAAASGVLDEPG